MTTCISSYLEIYRTSRLSRFEIITLRDYRLSIYRRPEVSRSAKNSVGEHIHEDEIIRDQEKRQKDSGPVAPESAQRSGRSLVEFFRHCPECGRGFHIKLESKKRLSLDRETIRRPKATMMRGPAGGVGRGRGDLPYQRIIVYEGEPIIIDIEELQYNYKCKHCGHEWSENRMEKHAER